MRIPTQTGNYCGKHPEDSVLWHGWTRTSGYVKGYVKDLRQFSIETFRLRPDSPTPFLNTFLPVSSRAATPVTNTSAIFDISRAMKWCYHGYYGYYGWCIHLSDPEQKQALIWRRELNPKLGTRLIDHSPVLTLWCTHYSLNFAIFVAWRAFWIVEPRDDHSKTLKSHVNYVDSICAWFNTLMPTLFIRFGDFVVPPL